MNLNFGANLKRLRRERDMTQEELADALGLSVQAISRYETSAAYPDIEMLPVIAGYFGVTVDYILGVSEKERESRRDDYYSRFRAADGADERIEILNKWRAEFPDDWMAVYNAMIAVGELSEERRDMNALRQIAKNALRRCTDPVWHDSLIYGYLNSEDDEKTALDFIDEYGSERDVSKLRLMSGYYHGHDESKERALYQYQMFVQINNVLDFLTAYRNVGDVRMAIEGCEQAIDILKKLSANPDLTKPDKWIDAKLLALLRLSNNYLFFDDRKNGFEALDTAVSLIENMINLPDGTKITCGTKRFDSLDCVTQKGVTPCGGGDCLSILNGLAIILKYENLPFDGKCPIDERNFYPADYRSIITGASWHNFARYKDDPEYQKYVGRVERADDVTDRKNVELILTHGVVQNPNGGRLCAVRTVGRSGKRLLHVLVENPQNGFTRALEQFDEAAGREGITESEAVMTADGNRNIVDSPQEVVDWLKLNGMGAEHKHN